MPKLIHYSQNRIDKLLCPIERICNALADHEKFKGITAEQLRDLPQLWQRAKPYGFWVSVEEDEEDWQDWKRWCLSEEFMTDCLQFAYEIILKPDVNILWISTPEQIDDLSNRYKHLPFKSERFGVSKDTGIFKHRSEMIHFLDWNPIRKAYQGIVISPYQWKRRLVYAGEGIDSSWYYGWDCASGCIWDIGCIEELKLISGPLVTCKST